MDTNAYLQAVLETHRLTPDAPELDAVRSERQRVEAIIRAAFPGAELAIRYGGSKAKNTMIRESFDLDVTSYFGHDDTTAGSSLKEIYDNVATQLEQDYFVEKRRSSLRLKTKGEQREFLHIDVVPGRFTDEDSGDVFLHQNEGDKQRLKTNLDVHIAHIRDSGVTDGIKLIKYWKWCNGLNAKTFVLELLAVDLLSALKSKGFDEQLLTFWGNLAHHIDDLSIEDPANPSGNDLSGIFSEAKLGLQIAAQTTLQTIESSGWQAVFGAVEDKASEAARTAALSHISTTRPQGARPWLP
jgi:hypothetical protein